VAPSIRQVQVNKKTTAKVHKFSNGTRTVSSGQPEWDWSFTCSCMEDKQEILDLLEAAKTAAEYYLAVADGKQVELSRPGSPGTWERPAHPLEAKAQQFREGWKFRVVAAPRHRAYRDDELRELLGSVIKHVSPAAMPFIYATCKPDDGALLIQSHAFVGGPRDGKPVGKEVP
jgi:hypothetical protein